MLYTLHARETGLGSARPMAFTLALVATGSVTFARVPILVSVKVGEGWGD